MIADSVQLLQYFIKVILQILIVFPGYACILCLLAYFSSVEVVDTFGRGGKVSKMIILMHFIKLSCWMEEICLEGL